MNPRRYIGWGISALKTGAALRLAGPVPTFVPVWDGLLSPACVSGDAGGEYLTSPEKPFAESLMIGAPTALTRTMTRADARAHSGPAIQRHGPFRMTAISRASVPLDLACLSITRPWARESRIA